MTPQPALRPDPIRDEWDLVEEYDLIFGGYHFHILPGKHLSTDGLSGPKKAILYRAIYPIIETKTIAAVFIHDICYRTGLVSQEVADQLLYDIMIENGTSKARAWIAKSGLKLLGKYNYMQNAEMAMEYRNIVRIEKI